MCSIWLVDYRQCNRYQFGIALNKVILTISNTNTSASITQYLTLPNGTYTLSAKCVSEYCNDAVTSMRVESVTNVEPTYLTIDFAR